MTAITTRTSALAVMPESTEGTPVVPTASGDYVPLQDDFSMEPAFATIENAELKASLGKSKSQLGAEEPTASFSHYLKHSGVEGTAPQYNEILKSLFGTESVRSTERDTVAGSTVSAINVDTGEGAEFQRGDAVLVKNSAGYEIRIIKSVAGDVLTPVFNLANAPGTGVNLGLSTSYIPANSGHQSLSLWHYLGNDGAIQMMAGAKATEMSIDITAGEAINASYSFEGLEYFFNPITIGATDTYLDFTDDGGTFAAQITAKTYKDPHDLAAALQTAMNSVQTAETHSVTYNDSDGKFTVSTSTSTVFSLLWNTGANTANTVGDKIGFSTGADDTGATSYESDTAQTYNSPQTPSFDSSDFIVAKNIAAFVGDADDTSCFEVSSMSITPSNTLRKREDICAVSGVSGQIVNERGVTISITSILNKYDADKFKRFRTNQATEVMVVFGTRSGGNWEPGKCGAIYAPASITSLTFPDDDGLIAMEMEFEAFVDADGNDEIYLSFV